MRDDSAVLDPPESGTEPEDDGLGSPGGDPDPGPEGGGSGGAPPTPPADLPDDGNGEPQDELPGLELDGERELQIKVGGRKPDASVLKLKGGSIDLKGQFDRGDRIVAVATLQVTGNHDDDTIETHTGDVKSTSRKQKATLCGITRIDQYVSEKLAAAGWDGKDIANVLDDLDCTEAE